jgi:hypothetical protein
VLLAWDWARGLDAEVPWNYGSGWNDEVRHVHMRWGTPMMDMDRDHS